MPNNLSRAVVERRAYELYEQRGRGDGHDWDDWLQAERELDEAAAQAGGRLRVQEPVDRRVAVDWNRAAS